MIWNLFCRLFLYLTTSWINTNYSSLPLWSRWFIRPSKTQLSRKKFKGSLYSFFVPFQLLRTHSQNVWYKFAFKERHFTIFCLLSMKYEVSLRISTTFNFLCTKPVEGWSKNWMDGRMPNFIKFSWFSPHSLFLKLKFQREIKSRT